jgi:prepilin-type N-terminal cleavage/methylation domain-containing protein
MIRRAFTLVELLVVITIIGVLIALLLPAVNAARESGRRAQCANNLKQLGAACLQHEEAQGYFPGGGWGSSWVGDPTLGYGRRQPGSWLFSILPNLDQVSLYRMGGSDPIAGTATSGNQMAGAQSCIGTALPFMNCPSRRRAVTYPAGGYKPINASPSAMVGRSDYAANAGNENDTVLAQPGPNVTTFKASGGGFVLADANWQPYYSSFVGYLPNGAQLPAGEPNGVIFLGSQVRKDDITDGLTNTFLLGEKFLNPNNYSNGADKGDGRSMYSGCSYDNERTTYGLNGMAGTPLQDHAEITTAAFDMFGSAHFNSCCFVFCDGSVNWIRYNIDATTYQSLGCRNDTLTIDASKL